MSEELDLDAIEAEYHETAFVALADWAVDHALILISALRAERERRERTDKRLHALTKHLARVEPDCAEAVLAGMSIEEIVDGFFYPSSRVYAALSQAWPDGNVPSVSQDDLAELSVAIINERDAALARVGELEARLAEQMPVVDAAVNWLEASLLLTQPRRPLLSPVQRHEIEQAFNRLGDVVSNFTAPPAAKPDGTRFGTRREAMAMVREMVEGQPDATPAAKPEADPAAEAPVSYGDPRDAELERLRGVVGELEASLRRAATLARLVTFGQVLDAGDAELSAAGLNPYCVNEGLAERDQRLENLWWIDSALFAARDAKGGA